MSDSVEQILAAIAALPEKEHSQLLERLAREAEIPPAVQGIVPLPAIAGALEGRPDYTIIFEGDSKGDPGPGYGSYALVRERDGKRRLVQLDFGRRMTKNEAEYETLIAGLQGLIERIESARKSPGDITLEVHGDSALVINQVQGTEQPQDNRTRLLRDRVRTLLALLKAHRLVHQNREESGRILGL